MCSVVTCHLTFLNGICPIQNDVDLFENKISDCLTQVANWRMEKLEVDSKSGSDEEFFDCIGEFCILPWKHENDCKLISNFCSFIYFN